MSTNKISILKVNKIYRRTLSLLCDDYNSTYEELLVSHNDIFIYQKHIKHLTVEVLNKLELRIHVAFLQKQPDSLQLKKWKYYLLLDRPIMV